MDEENLQALRDVTTLLAGNGTNALDCALPFPVAMAALAKFS
jgi:hypothetical protein